MSDMFSPTLPADFDVDEVLGNLDLINDAHAYLAEEGASDGLADDYALLRRALLLLIVTDNLSRAKFEQAITLARGLE